MDKMIVMLFDTETKAYEASRALADLRREGSLAVYSGAVIAKDSSGQVAVRQAVDQGPGGTAIGLATGALIGALGGPAGLTLGAAAGALGGSMADFANAGVGLDFLDEVSAKLGPGKAAVVAEIDEEWITPLDTRMEALGGTIYRRPRVEVVDAQIERDAAALEAELDQLQSEFDQARGEAKSKLKAKIDTAKVSLAAAKNRAKKRIDDLNREAQAKIQSLQNQASKASGNAKERLERRAQEMKADHQARAEKLSQAWHLTQETFRPSPAFRR